MKTIEEKAQRYDEAIERAMKLQETCDSQAVVGWCEYIFPELKESEDGKIRKEIVRFLRMEVEDEIVGNKWIAWLEKLKVLTIEEDLQGKEDVLWCIKQAKKYAKDENEMGTCWFAEQWLEKQGEKPQGKTAIEAVNEEKIDNQNCIKDEPKFNDGDWVVWNNKIYCHVDNIYQGKESLMYAITDTNNMIRTYSVKDFDRNAHLWTIADAKEGDVLKEDSCIFIIKKINPNGTAIAYCCLFNDGDFDLSSTLSFDVDSTYPATKSQRDTLMNAMADAGYEWNAEKKELKKIEENSFESDRVVKALRKAGYEWSEETHQMKKIELNNSDKVEPKFKVGDIMRTLQEAKDGYTDGLPVVVSIDNEYYHCTNELIAIKDQDGYEFPSISIKPKFKVGDWVVDTIIGGVWHIDSINKEYYKVSDGRGNDNDCPIIRQDEIHLWTIEDAKAGDVLASNYNKPFIYNGNYNSRHVGAHCGITTNDKLIIASEECHWTENLNIHPANKDQRDILMNAMNDDGYVFDFDKKELKKKIYLSAKHNSQPIKPTDE